MVYSRNKLQLIKPPSVYERILVYYIYISWYDVSVSCDTMIGFFSVLLPRLTSRTHNFLLLRIFDYCDFVR